MITIDPKSIETAKLQGIYKASVGLNTIAFASTMDVAGNANVSPFSFFLMFLVLIHLFLFSHRHSVQRQLNKTHFDQCRKLQSGDQCSRFDMVQQISLSQHRVC
jgi:hypothetical protein